MTPTLIEAARAALVERKNSGQVTQLSERQVETLERLHAKHFAG